MLSIRHALLTAIVVFCARPACAFFLPLAEY